MKKDLNKGKIGVRVNQATQSNTVLVSGYGMRSGGGGCGNQVSCNQITQCITDNMMTQFAITNLINSQLALPSGGLLTNLCNAVTACYEAHIAVGGTDPEFLAEMIGGFNEPTIIDKVLAIVNNALATQPNPKLSNLCSYINKCIDDNLLIVSNAAGNIITTGPDGGAYLNASSIGTDSLISSNSGHTIATHVAINGATVNINETITSLGNPTLVNNVLTIPFVNESGVIQAVTVNLSGIAPINDIQISNATYNAATNIITLTETNGDIYNINLSEFSIIPNTLANGDIEVTQEGIVKFVIPKDISNLTCNGTSVSATNKILTTATLDANTTLPTTIVATPNPATATNKFVKAVKVNTGCNEDIYVSAPEDICSKVSTTQIEANATNSNNIFMIICGGPNDGKKVPLSQLNVSAVSTAPVMGGTNTTTASPTGTTTGTATGSITSNGGDGITSNGFVIYPTGNASTIIGGVGVTNNIVTPTIQSGNITTNFTGLTPGTTYCTKPRATNAIGTTYGDEECFTTNNTPAVMGGAGTTTVSAITTTGATLGGNIVNAGSCAIVENGFVIYPAGTIPTTIGSANVTKITTATVQSGNISAPATGLSNTSNYCFKPYATNCTGTTYGVELCFTTLTVGPTIITVQPSGTDIAKAYRYYSTTSSRIKTPLSGSYNYFLGGGWAGTSVLIFDNNDIRDITFNIGSTAGFVNKKIWFDTNPNLLRNTSGYDMQFDAFVTIDGGTPIAIGQTNIAVDSNSIVLPSIGLSGVSSSSSVRFYIVPSSGYPNIWNVQYDQYGSHSIGLLLYN